MFVILEKLIEQVEFSVVEPSVGSLVRRFLDVVSVSGGQRGVRKQQQRNVCRNVKVIERRAGRRIALKVGSDSSLAANGSSVVRVAGKKRSPAKP